MKQNNHTHNRITTRIAYLPLIITVASCLGLVSSRAAVQGFFVIVSATNTYQVPPGKVLVLQQFSRSSGTTPVLLLKDSNGSSISIGSANSSGSTAVPAPDYPDLVVFASPLKLPGGASVGVPPGGGSIAIFGLLVDPVDLYAASAKPSPVMESLAVTGGTITGEIALASPEPVTVRLQSSTDLLNWQGETNATLLPSTNRTHWTFAASTHAAGQRYFRALVRPH